MSLEFKRARKAAVVEGEGVEDRVVLLQKAEMVKEDDIMMQSPGETGGDGVAIEIPETAHEVSSGSLSFCPLSLSLYFPFFCFVLSVSVAGISLNLICFERKILNYAGGYELNIYIYLD